MGNSNVYGVISYFRNGSEPYTINPTYIDSPNDWERDVEKELWHRAHDKGRCDNFEVFYSRDEFHTRLGELLYERDYERDLQEREEQLELWFRLWS